MAVVISGTNNSDKITATDGLIDLLSSVNFASEVSVPSFKVGSDIQIGNAGIITATTLVGNVQGNINHTSNLLLQISGSEKFRVGTSGQLGIGGANYGTSGQVLTSGGSGSAASWTTITGTTINNNAANKVIMGSNTANTLEAVAKSSLFSQINHGQSFLDDNYLIFGDASDLQLVHQSSGAKARIRNTNDSGSLDIESTLTRFTNKDGSTEKLRISSTGNVGINQTSPQRKLHIGTSGTAEANIRIQGGADYGEIRVKDSDNELSFHHNVGGAGSRELFSANGSTGHFSINCYSYEALTLTTNENGSNGPQIQLMHNSASPAANDYIGQLRFSGKDSAGNTTLYGKIDTIVDDVTDGQETSHIDFSTRGYSAYNTMLRLKRRGTASAPSYTADDIDGIILDVYNTGNPYPRYMNLIAKAAGNTESNIGFWTEAVSGSPSEKLRITSQGTTFVKADGTAPVNQAQAGHYSGTGYNAGNALGLMVKRAIHVSDADTKGVGGMFLSHTRNVACNGTTYNMFTLHNREGAFVGDIYVGFSANSAGAVRHYKFTCLYGTNNLTSVDFNRRTNNENLTVNISSSNNAHFFQVIPTMSGGSVQRVSMTIVGACCGRNDGSGGDYYTVSYNS